jgi:hypothetical protein
MLEKTNLHFQQCLMTLKGQYIEKIELGIKYWPTKKNF